MKNKKAQQEEDRARYKALVSKRSKNTGLDRKTLYLSVKPTILIVCDGENTETSYFNQFRLTSAKIKTIGEGYNTVSLVERTKELSEKAKYDQVWCVFDKNSFNTFNQAIRLAKQYKFRIAYSNQAFEYWLILHFQDHQGGGMHRNLYNGTLNKALKKYGIEYDGNGQKLVTQDLFDLMMGFDNQNKRRIDSAIERAKRIYDQFDHVNPSNEESLTTVHLLVQELLKHT